ncbi:MAG: hypothetical protein AW07_03271 [Candidatus Accumulibacter sp. SK-11]|nr:MAG: hypothetical protein AW07_03271 [Candidatus Accumulibacter sp. SK-11]
MPTGAEIPQCGLLAGWQGSRVAQPGKPHVARGCRRTLLGVGVVGEEGGQPLTPVPQPRLNVDAVAPPVVQHLVPERSGANERQAQDIDAEVGQSRHAKTGRQRTGDDREGVVRVGTDERTIALDVTLTVGEIAIGKPRFGVESDREVGTQA